MKPEQSKNWQILIKEQMFNNLLMEWNTKINLVSRQKKNIYDLIEDSKIFLRAIEFKQGMKILDLGTGGGVPGIILAIHLPEVNFILVDSIQKKINVVSNISQKMDLTNIKTICSRTEEIIKKGILPQRSIDVVVSRSVAVLQELCAWSKELIKPAGKLIALKGGDIAGELQKTRKLSFVKNVTKINFGDRILVKAEFI
ncbi:MAG: 16S rRNA (guanine(527)-N(7))-methyltransferase RsmG [Ignavibacteria bacterium]|nr:16S rRNA (guanine(527)-N(7))-methyltransferase RsmG [Ignavibacteria bacterium]